MKGLLKGPSYVIGTQFCFPPIYARFMGKKGWTWTSDVGAAKAFSTKQQAETRLTGNAGLKELLGQLDDVVSRRIKVLQVTLQVSPV